MIRIGSYHLLMLLLFLISLSTVFQVAHSQLKPPVTRNFKCLSNGCCDHHEWCRFWASTQECHTNADFMQLTCQLACKTCQAPVPNPISVSPIHTQIRLLPATQTFHNPPATVHNPIVSQTPTITPHRNPIVTNPPPIIPPRKPIVPQPPPILPPRNPVVPIPPPIMPPRIPVVHQPPPIIPPRIPVVLQPPPIIPPRIPAVPQPPPRIPIVPQSPPPVPPTRNIAPVPSPIQRPTANAGSCEQISQNPSNAADQLIQSGLINPIEDTTVRTLLSLSDITTALSASCVPQLSSADCTRNLCYHLAYRSLDGACNNLNKPLLGAAFRPFIRFLPALYENGFEAPVASTRPTPRELSSKLLSSTQVVSHNALNSLLMQFGQFISHDLARTSLQPTSGCTTCTPVPSKCVPVPVKAGDPNQAFVQKGCIKIARAAPVCGTGFPGRPREQLNENTAFIDGSPVYGSSTVDLTKFRDGRTGLLKMSRFNNLMVLPFDEATCSSNARCTEAKFTAGDVRVNLFLGLSSVQILFTREHNRLNPSWSGDRLFQEARKIVGAQIQAIVYRDYLPRLLGPTFDRLIGPYQSYNPSIDPTIANEFTTAAYRFGHGFLVESYPRLEENNLPSSFGPFVFGDGVLESKKVLLEGGIDPILRGLWNTPLKLPHRMTPEITERLLGSTDLGSLNIMRGRDNGIPPYNRWREHCKLSPARTFSDLQAEMSNWQLLTKFYTSPEDVDLYVGGMLENPIAGGLTGPTFACIIGDQFKRTRDGDRFYFENPGIFTNAQLNELRKASFSRLLCENGDRILQVPSQAFVLPSGGPTVACNQVPGIDLTKWKE